MSYPIKVGNIEVVVKSLDEAVELIGKLSKTSANGNGNISSRTTKTMSRSEFVESLPDWPKRGLKALAERGRVKSSLLCTTLGLKNNMALTGRVLTPITRKANAAGIDPLTVIMSERIQDANDNWERIYWIPKEYLDDVKKGLKMKE